MEMLNNKYISFALGVLVVVLAFVAWHYFILYSSISNVIVDPKNSNQNIFQVASSTGVPYLTVTAAGRVGVNTTVPTTDFEVRGVARIYTPTPQTCTKEIEGAIAYDPLRKHFFGCNAVKWVLLDTP